MSDVMQRIYQQLDRMPASHRAIAEVVSTRPGEVATMTIDGLASAAGVSNASANRFARNLGYERYADFRNGLIRALKVEDRPEKKLLSVASEVGDVHLAWDIIRQNSAILSQTAERLDFASVELATQILCRARRVYVLGFGTSFFVASYASLLFEPLLDDVREVALAGGAGKAARRLSSIGSEDALLVVSMPRFNREALRLTQLANAAGADVIGMTSEPLAPILAHVDVPLIVSADHRVFASSIVSAIALVEAIAACVAANCPRSGAAMENMMRWISPYMVDPGPPPQTSKDRPQPGHKPQRRGGRE